MLAILFIAAGTFVSCNDDNEASAESTVQLLSFGPSGQEHGQKISFIGKNLDRVTAIKLEGVEISQGDFVSQTADQIEIIIPMETLEGKAILVFDGGEVMSKTVLSFDVPFMVTNITSEARPGDNITITGNYLQWIKSVVFTDGIEVTEFESSTANTLVVKVPLDAKTGPLTIVGGGTELYTFVSESDLKVTLPMVSSVSPESVKHSDVMTITGTNLDLVKSVTFPNSEELKTFESQTATQIVIKVPNTAKDGKLTVTALSGVVTETEVAVKIILPAVTSAMPQPVDIGAAFTLIGTNLDLVKEVIIPGVTAGVTNFTSQSATQIVLDVPVGAFKGAIKLMTIHGFLVETTAKIDIAGVTDIPLARVIFDDELRNGFNDWSWSTKNTIITSEVKEGTSALKVEYTGDGGLKLANATLSTLGMSELVFSIYGGEGLANENKLGLMVNDKWGVKTITVTPGKWVEFAIPLSELKSLGVVGIETAVKEMALQNKSGYFIIDKVGLR